CGHARPGLAPFRGLSRGGTLGNVPPRTNHLSPPGRAAVRPGLVVVVPRCKSTAFLPTMSADSSNPPFVGEAMRGSDAVRTALQSTPHLVTWFLGDLSDADLVVRPSPGANHIAWQMGHLIQSERHLIGSNVAASRYPDLPAGFAERHTKDGQARESPADF